MTDFTTANYRRDLVCIGQRLHLELASLRLTKGLDVFILPRTIARELAKAFPDGSLFEDLQRDPDPVRACLELKRLGAIMAEEASQAGGLDDLVEALAEADRLIGVQLDSIRRAQRGVKPW